mgnify:CR=1 FL=1
MSARRRQASRLGGGIALTARLGLGAVLATWLIAGCQRESEPPAVVRDVAERGPLRLTVEAEPKEVIVGDAVRVRVTFEAPHEYEVQLPEAAAFESLSARVVATPEPRPGERGTVWQREFVLEPAVSGKLEIPSLEVGYRGRADRSLTVAAGINNAAETQPVGQVSLPDGRGLEQSIVSRSLTVEVRSVLTAQDKPESPRDITATRLPPEPPRPVWQWAVLVGGVAAGACALYFAYRAWRKWATRPPPPILPEVWALRALAELDALDWDSSEQVRTGYYRLTEIVREYIERKFGLAAPEMTTEEFLRALSRRPQALPYDAYRLREFLEACDRVKYAAVQPGVEETRGVIMAARAFVNATARSEPRPSGSGPTAPRDPNAGIASPSAAGGQAA